MNESQKSMCISYCEQIESFNFDTHISTGQSIGRFTFDEYISLTKRIAKQLKEELVDGYGDFLPYIIHSYDSGQSNVEYDLLSLISNYSLEAYPSKAIALERLIYHQISNGFWDRSVRKIHNAKDVKINETNDKIMASLVMVQKELEKLAKEKEALENFTAQKTNELQQIVNNLQTANTHTSQINDLLVQSTQSAGQINSLYDQQNSKLNSLINQQDEKLLEIKQHIQEYQKEYQTQKTEIEATKIDYDKSFKDFSSQVQEKLDEFENKNTEFAEKLKFVEDKKAFFEDRNNYLKDLIDREVGASLFETFKLRKIELSKGINFWTWGLSVSIILAIIWIFIVFGYSDFSSVTDQNLRWQYFILNIIKVAPAIFLIYFTSNQYRKERNFQEAYAFKSAVALTIKAYVDQLSVPENKDKLLMQSVETVYTSPIQQKASNTESKSMKDYIKEMTESIKTVKDTINDVAKPK